MPALGATVSACVWRAGVVWIGAALACALLTSCARDPIVAEFNLDGAPTAINAAYAGCPPHRPTQPAAAAPRPRSS